jgi:hypothetical protein
MEELIHGIMHTTYLFRKESDALLRRALFLCLKNKEWNYASSSNR